MRGWGYSALAVAASLATAACESRSAPAPDASLPAWLRRQVSEGGRFPPVIEQVTYNGQPAYHTIATDRFDTGDEHGLFTADGRLICRFGGYAGRVTSGSCDMDRIIFVSTLYDAET
jgi:hypothetical protein